MILGMSLRTFTYLHVYISLIAIGAGFIVVYGMIAARRFPLLTNIFLFMTVLTSLTGFLFPNEHITPGIKVGILSMIILALAIVARYTLALAGGWRRVYTLCAVAALYFNCFVGVVQAFEKVPFLNALAPTQKEPPFAIAQGLLLVSFLVLGTLAFKRFRSEPIVARQSTAA